MLLSQQVIWFVTAREQVRDEIRNNCFYDHLYLIVALILRWLKSIYVDYFKSIFSSRWLHLLLCRYFDYQLSCWLFTLQPLFNRQNINLINKVAQGAPSSSYLPLKGKPSRVIPIIFAKKFSITAAPAAILQILVLQVAQALVRTLQEMLSTTSPDLGVAMYTLLIIHILYICTDQSESSRKLAEWSYIHGVRLVGNWNSCELSSPCYCRINLPWCDLNLAGVAKRCLWAFRSCFAFGELIFLIIISTGIEGIKQLEGYLLKRKYVGFMDKTGHKSNTL